MEKKLPPESSASTSIELQGHHIDDRTLLIYRYDPANEPGEDELRALASALMQKLPNWAGLILAMPTNEDVATMPEAKLRELYAALHGVFGKDTTAAPAADPAQIDLPLPE